MTHFKLDKSKAKESFPKETPNSWKKGVKEKLNNLDMKSYIKNLRSTMIG